jgi:DNA-directed RNA polymerase subunit RPC12/RpoP
MQSLEDYEREKEAEAAPDAHESGIACPDCGAELVDEGNQLFSRVPPMKRVACQTCGFSKVVRA